MNKVVDQEAELVFIPAPGMGHLVSTVEMAKLLIARDRRLSVTVLIMKSPFDPKLTSYTQSISATSSHLRFVDLHLDDSTATELLSRPPVRFLSDFIDSHKNQVRDAVSEMSTRNESTQIRRIVGLVIDMFCIPMMDVAAEFGLPTFVFFTSSAAFLGLILHIQALKDDRDYCVTELKDSDDAELAVPSFANPVPAKVLPSVAFDKEGGSTYLLNVARKLRETNGIMVNTFRELEPHAVESLAKDDKIPTIYPVGPILNLESSAKSQNPKWEEIMGWLDDQPPSSVIFLCFGSRGSFGGDQVVEIARALESSGHRFLWALRRPAPKEKIELPGDYENLSEVLPEGFLERTAEVGRVIGWAPQVAVLSHQAVGGFVSHCGWNSTLEGLWCGVPVATWPMYAEQQTNAFEMVRELGLAVEVRMDYRTDFRMESEVIVTAAEIESGISQLMDGGEKSSEIKKKVKRMSENSRIAVVEGGSSFNSIKRFIEDVISYSSET